MERDICAFTPSHELNRPFTQLKKSIPTFDDPDPHLFRKILSIVALSLTVSCTKLPMQSVKQTDNACKKNSPEAYVTKIVQDMGNRPPGEDELAFAKKKDFSPDSFIDYISKTPLIDDAIAKFVANLFRLASLTAKEGESPQLTMDLMQEPIVLVQKNKEKPWSYFFTTEDIFCTQETAALYGYPKSSVPGFVSCKVPKERGGFLSLISVLRVTSPAENPQAFLLTGNNYHRVKSTIYFATGKQIASATDGPKGDENDLVPLAACVPTSDMRKKDGLVYGTASVPLEGRACSACHSRHMAPLSVAFRQFGPAGELLTAAALDEMQNPNFDLPMSDMKALMQENKSCWAARDETAETQFIGLKGLGQVIALNADLGDALGRQIPQNMANIEPTASQISAIKTSYEKGGKTLLAAMQGFFTSERYTCQ